MAGGLLRDAPDQFYAVLQTFNECHGRALRGDGDDNADGMRAFFVQSPCERKHCDSPDGGQHENDVIVHQRKIEETQMEISESYGDLAAKQACDKSNNAGCDGERGEIGLPVFARGGFMS